MTEPEPAHLHVSLLPGEQIDALRSEETSYASDADLNRRYAKDGVLIVVEQARYPLNQILSMFTDTFQDEHGRVEPKYKRDPEYQRRHRWDDGRKSRLVESFLMNVPVPPIFLYEYDFARFEVMDGRQRLTALIDFYNDDFSLTGLQYWPELHGRRYSTLPSSIRDGIDRRYLSSIILLNETAASADQAAFLKKLVFERLNSGGVRLSPQETRNAVYNGPLNDLCLNLSHTYEFRAMLGTPPDASFEAVDGEPEDGEESESDPVAKDEQGVQITNIGRKMFESMEDVEIVLRFYAYRHLAKFPQGLNRISDFLDEFLMRGNRFDTETLERYRGIFLENLSFWYSTGGPTAFQVRGSKRKFSKIAFDALMYASSALTKEQRTHLRANPDAVIVALENMYTFDLSIWGGRRTNTADANRRNIAALGALERALEVPGE